LTANRTVEERLRRFLLTTAAVIFAGTVVELWFAEHVESTVQLVPFGLCALGTAAAVAALAAPRRRVLLLVRGVMAAVALGSLYGWYAHLAHNLAFEQEIRPNAPFSAVFWEALSGASPLLAPGILALAAALALASTYGHPALQRPAG
jgi:hypothetical protein